MNYNTELKIIKLERGHPFVQTIDILTFSNELEDMVKIQQSLNKKLKAQDNKFDYKLNEFNRSVSKNMNELIHVGEAVGSVLE